MTFLYAMATLWPKVKYRIPILFLALLYTNAIAQVNKAVDLTTKGIQIGQQVPDITITHLHNYKDSSGKPATTAKLSDFKGKLLILDFWATWCSPCIAMIPKMDSLQKAFRDKVQFLSVTYQSEKEVLPFWEKFEIQRGKHYDLPVATDSKELHKMFPHISLPHYVWIDADGVVKAITESKDVNNYNLEEILSGNTEMNKKSDYIIAYDNNKPFLINGNGGDGSDMLLYHSILTKYAEGISPSYSRTSFGNNSVGKISCRNTSISQLFRIAYGEYEKYLGLNRTIFDVTNINLLSSGTVGMEYLDWLRDNGYFYELIVPANLSSRMFEIMKNDLSNLFPQYIAKIEKRKVKCLVLKRTSRLDKIKSTGGKSTNDFSALGFEMKNSSLSSMIMRMEVQYMQNSPYPIVDGTNYKGAVDLKIDARLTDISDLNANLAKYDLKFELEDFFTDVLIIEDRLHQTK